MKRTRGNKNGKKEAKQEDEEVKAAGFELKQAIDQGQDSSDEEQYSSEEEENLVSSEEEELREDELGSDSSSVEEPESEEEKTKNLAELSDSDDETGEKNRIGNVPLEWYDDEDHIGYDVTGKRIIRKNHGDALDEFLSRTDDPDRWRTIYDKLNDEKIVLSKEEMDIVHRIRQGKFPDRHFDPYEDVGFRVKPRVESLHNATVPKRSFVPSKGEAKLVARLVRAIRNGWIRKKGDEPEKPKTFLMWDSESTDELPKYHIPAPKTKLPGHAESYNPPAEYLPTEEEKAKWAMEAPEDRPYNYIPTKFNSLREVPNYGKFIKERFERCLDLYLCPRARRKRLNIDPETLIPKLPKAASLKPFPTEEAITYEGHEGMVKSISVSPDGQWLASGSSDKTVRIWEVSTGRCTKVATFDDTIDVVAWCPNPQTPMLAIAMKDKVTVMHTGTGSVEEEQAVEKLLSTKPDNDGAKIEWEVESENELTHRMAIHVKKRAKSLVWHVKGDYLASASPDSTARSVQIHRISQGRTHLPFTKSKGYVQRVAFHPNKSFFFVVTKRHIRVYNLSKQEMVKKMRCPSQWISSIDVHPAGDNFVIGSYDCKVCWYDMDLSDDPYKTLRFHKKAVRQVSYSKRFPLFASASDDGKIHVFHGRVYDDFLTNPLIVPVKILNAHVPQAGLGTLDCVFHPTQPWIFTSGADKLIKLFC